MLAIRLPARGRRRPRPGVRLRRTRVRRSTRGSTHHAAGRLDGRVGGGGRLRSRRLAGLLRHQQPRGQPQSPVSQQGRRHVRGRRAQVGVADVNRRETGVSMGAVWGDYDNDGYEDLFLYRYGRPELFHNEEGRRFVAARRARRPAGSGSTPTAPRGSTTTATAGSICSSPATGTRTSTSGSSRRRASCRRASSTPTTAAASICCGTAATAPSRTGPSALGITSRRWTLAVAAADLLGTGYPGPVPRQRLRRLGAVRNRGGKRVRGRRARDTAWASRRRAA